MAALSGAYGLSCLPHTPLHPLLTCQLCQLLNSLHFWVLSGGLSVSCAGPGAQGFYQSDTHTGPTSVSPLAYLINGVAHAHPSQQQQQCHGAKPVLLNVGEANKPYPWVPRVTEVALLRLGNFVSIIIGMTERSISREHQDSWAEG